MRPGDVALDNDTLLEPGMVFMIHPNQYLPETGYLLCGEPVLLTASAAGPREGRAARWRADNRAVASPVAGVTVGRELDSAYTSCVFTQHPTLLIGPSDWDEARAPKAEFEQRIAALWAAFPDASQAIVFGSAAPPRRARLSHPFRAEARARHRAALARRRATSSCSAAART